MRLEVDLNRCQGYAQCAFVAPALFSMHGEEGLMYHANADDAHYEDALRAEAACPVQAVFVERRERVAESGARSGAEADAARGARGVRR